MKHVVIIVVAAEVIITILVEVVTIRVLEASVSKNEEAVLVEVAFSLYFLSRPCRVLASGGRALCFVGLSCSLIRIFV